MFSDIFIRRPILATVCSLLIILAGAIAIPILPIARYPELAPPSVTVSAFYTGANAQAVESAVTTPLEQAINGVEGMTYMTSSSTNSGSATITVTEEATIAWDKDVINGDEFLARLRAFYLQDPNAKILINGDENAKFSQAIYVFDEVRKAGFQKVLIETRVRPAGSDE